MFRLKECRSLLFFLPLASRVISSRSLEFSFSFARTEPIHMQKSFFFRVVPLCNTELYSARRQSHPIFFLYLKMPSYLQNDFEKWTTEIRILKIAFFNKTVVNCFNVFIAFWSLGAKSVSEWWLTISWVGKRDFISSNWYPLKWVIFNFEGIDLIKDENPEDFKNIRQKEKEQGLVKKEMTTPRQ